jgi:hypothetical protein
MKTTRTLWIGLLAVLLGCSSEGGVVGSGISSVSGNVVAVELNGTTTSGTTAAAVDLPVTLRVSIDEAPGIDAIVDPQAGEFELSGDFAGPITLRFADADADHDLATLAVEVPSGTAVVLEDVEIGVNHADFRVVRHVGFLGNVTDIDCANGLLQVVDDAPMMHTFTVRLLADTQLRRRNGIPLTCTELRRGDRVAVEEGIVHAEEFVIDAVLLVVAPGRRAEEPIPVERRGNLVRAECDTGLLHVHDPGFADLVRVLITPETAIDCAGVAMCTCADLQAADRLEIAGIIRPGRPGRIEAQHITVQARPASFPVRVVGMVREVDCASGHLRVNDPRVERHPALQLVAATEIVCVEPRPRRPCTCTDIAVRDHVEVDAIVYTDREGPPDATRVRVFARRRGGAPG